MFCRLLSTVIITAFLILTGCNKPDAPTAGFSGSPREVQVSLNVNFTDLSTGQVDSWSWTFGDDGTSNEQNPSHPYDTTGYFTVSLTVTGPGGSDSETQYNYIHVTRRPHITMSRTTMSFSAVQYGPLPGSQTFTITNSGGGTLNWSVSDDATWLVESPTNGNSNSATITVSVNTTDLSVGPHNATITVFSTNADNSPQTIHVTYTITGPPHIVLSRTTMSFSAVQNGPLPGSQTFTITNSGGGTLNWSVSDDATWLVESPTNGNSNSDTITVSVNTTDLSVGPHYATITVSSTNADNSPQTIDVTYIISRGCQITVTRPDSTDNWTERTSHDILWTYQDGGNYVKIELYKGSGLQCLITNQTANNGSYSWVVDDCGGGWGSDYRIKISNLSDPDSCYDYSDYFTIGGCSITVTRPNSSDSWQDGTSQNIQWTSQCAGAYVRIELWKGGSMLCTISSSTANDGSYSWVVDDCGGGNGNDYRIKITDTSNSACYDFSDYFTIGGCSITVTRPNSADNWTEGTTHDILWTYQGGGNYVKIELYRVTYLCTISYSTENDGSYSWVVDPCGGPTATNYQIKITDTSNSACFDYSEQFTITRVPYCDVYVSVPNSGSNWDEGRTYRIDWNMVGNDCGPYASITLHKGGSLVAVIEPLAPQIGYYDWLVNDYDEGSGSDYQIKVADSNDNNRYDFSDNFTITPQVYLVFTWLPSGNFYLHGNYPSTYRNLETSYRQVYYEDPSWSGCETPDGTVHAKFDPFWPLSAYLDLRRQGYDGIYAHSSTNSLHFTITADFRVDNTWLKLIVDSTEWNFLGNITCEDYEVFNGISGGGYYPVRLLVETDQDEVAMSRLRIDFVGWVGNYDFLNAQGTGRPLLGEEHK